MDHNLTTKEIYLDVEKAIDYAFIGKFVLNFYQYLKIKNTKRKEVEEFLDSSCSKNILEIVKNLEEYLEGGSDSSHKQLREAYGHIPKPEARKIKNYLNQILEDSEKYIDDKRPGRKRKQTK
jgi:hypothetical protein